MHTSANRVVPGSGVLALSGGGPLRRSTTAALLIALSLAIMAPAALAKPFAPAGTFPTADAGTTTVAAAAAVGGGGPIVFSSLRDGNSELYSVQPDGTGVTRLTKNRAFDGFASLSPDGTRVAFVSTRHGNFELYAMNLDGTDVVRLTNHKAIDTEPDWSPNGERIAFTSSRSGGSDIWTASSTDGGGLARLTDHKAIDVSPAWSPDGKQLAFVSLRSGLGDVYRMQADGSGLLRLTTSFAPDLFPAWSPNGAKLAFASLRSGSSDIYTMNPDGTQQTRRTRSSTVEIEPAWSPDGNKLVISSTTPGSFNFDLHLLNADGTGATPLAAHPRLDGSPDWAHGRAAPPPFDGTATPVLDWQHEVSATIGRSGGTLLAGRVTLSIPPGALSEDKQITMTPLIDLADSPLSGSLIGGVKMEPEGLLFLKPALLSMPLPAGVSPADVLGFGSAGDGSDLHLRPRTIAVDPITLKLTITLELWHFSTGGASSGGAAAASAMQSYQPTSAEGRALQRIAAATPGCEAERVSGIFNGPACTHLEQETVRALFDWYVNAVKPALELAVGAPSFQLEAALQEWLSWAATVAAKLNGELNNELSQAKVLASDAVADFANRRLNNCTGTSLASQLRDVARVADFVQAGDVDLAAEGLPEDLLRACAHLRIEVLEFPAVAALLYANTLRGRVTVDVYTGPDRTDVPFTLTVDGASVGAAGDGSFQTAITPTATPVNVPLEATATDVALQNTSFSASTNLVKTARERVELEALAPVGTLGPGDTVPLRVRVAGDGMSNATVTYSVSGIGQISAASGTTDTAGEAPVFDYSVPASGPAGTGTVTASFQGATDSLTMTVQAQIAVTVSPSSATLAPGDTQQFSATVTGATNPAVTWTATGTATGGSIDANSGLYTAGTTLGSFTVTATSVENPAQSGTASVTVGAAGIEVLQRSGTAAVGVCVGPSFTSGCAVDGALQQAPPGIGSFSLSASKTFAFLNTGSGGSGTADATYSWVLDTSASSFTYAGSLSASGSSVGGGHAGGDADDDSLVEFRISAQNLRWRIQTSVSGDANCGITLYKQGESAFLFAGNSGTGPLDPGVYTLEQRCRVSADTARGIPAAAGSFTATFSAEY